MILICILFSQCIICSLKCQILEGHNIQHIKSHKLLFLLLIVVYSPKLEYNKCHNY